MVDYLRSSVPAHLLPFLRRDRRAGRRLTGLVLVFDVCADDGFPVSEVQRSRLVYRALIAARDLLVEFERHIARHLEVTGEVCERRWRASELVFSRAVQPG